MESKPGFVSAAPLLNYNRFRPFPWKRKLIAAGFSFIIDSTGPINSEARYGRLVVRIQVCSQRASAEFGMLGIWSFEIYWNVY